MERMAALAIRSDRDAALVKMAEANAAARVSKRETKEEVKSLRSTVAKLKKSTRQGFVEDRAVTAIGGTLGAVGGALLQVKVIDPKIQNVWLRRGLLPVSGLMVGGAGLAFLNGTAASAIGGAGLGIAAGSLIVQLVKWVGG
jgi:hypothetical protein